MSSVYFNTSCAAVSEASPNTTYGDQPFDANALSTEGYQGYIVYYPTPSYYYVYNVVTPVEMNGATFYYYSAYATPFYSILLDDLNSVSNVSSDMDAVSPDFDLSHLFEEDEDENNILLNDLNSVSNVSSDMDALSPDFVLSHLFEEDEYDNNKLRIKEPVVDAISLNGEEEKENNLSSDKSEEMLDSTNASVELSSEDVSPQTDKCHGDYDKKFGNDAVIKLLSDSIHENTSQKESSESIVDNREFLNDLSFDIVEDQEFKIEASYCGPSADELLGQSSYNDLDEDTFNSPFPPRKVFKKLRYFKTEIEVLPTIYEEDEPPEDEEELPEEIDEVESSKNPKKKRFRRLRRWFAQLTSCCRKNKKPPD